MADSTSSFPGASAPQTVTSAPRPRRGNFVNALLMVGIIVTVALFGWAEWQRREAQSKLTQTATQLEDLRKAAETSGQAVADEVLRKLRRHIDIPADPQPTVATIVEAAALKDSHEFYQPADNGDHLVITATRAILYDGDRDIILDVVPATIEDNQDSSSSPSSSGSASPTPAP